MTRLAPEMTVQAVEVGVYGYSSVAYCVRCKWQSRAMSYRMARQLACGDKSHACVPVERVRVREVAFLGETRAESRVDDIRASLRRLERELAELERFPEDDFAEGTIIRFELELRNSGVIFTYAAIKVTNQWWVTDRHLPGEAEGARGGIDYDTLRRILTKARNVRLFTGDGEPLERPRDAAAETAAPKSTATDSSPETHL